MAEYEQQRRTCNSCKRRMSAKFTFDTHTLCLSCRGVECDLENFCSECQDWSMEDREAYVKHLNKLKRQRESKDRRGSRSEASSVDDRNDRSAHSIVIEPNLGLEDELEDGARNCTIVTPGRNVEDPKPRKRDVLDEQLNVSGAAGGSSVTFGDLDAVLAPIVNNMNNNFTQLFNMINARSNVLPSSSPAPVFGRLSDVPTADLSVHNKPRLTKGMRDALAETQGRLQVVSLVPNRAIHCGSDSDVDIECWDDEEFVTSTPSVVTSEGSAQKACEAARVDFIFDGISVRRAQDSDRSLGR